MQWLAIKTETETETKTETDTETETEAEAEAETDPESRTSKTQQGRMGTRLLRARAYFSGGGPRSGQQDAAMAGRQTETSVSCPSDSEGHETNFRFVLGVECLYEPDPSPIQARTAPDLRPMSHPDSFPICSRFATDFSPIRSVSARFASLGLVFWPDLRITSFPL